MRVPALLAALTLTGLLTQSANPALAEVSTDGIRLEPQTAQVAGTAIAFAEVGQGPPLLLLNGTASPMSEWDPALLAGLAHEHRVIVFDYPGLGLSGPAPGRWTFEAAADWTAEFLDEVAPEEAVDMLGWSMGGFIAQRLAIQHPQQVRRLILAATNPGGDQAVLGPPWVQAADSHGGLKAYVRTNYPAGQRDRGWDFISRLTAAVDSGAYPDEAVPRATARAMVRAEYPWLRSNVNDTQLRMIDVPTLVITGEQDRVTPSTNSRHIAQRIPGAQLVLVPEAGHSFLFQNPQREAQRFSDFLLARDSKD